MHIVECMATCPKVLITIGTAILETGLTPIEMVYPSSQLCLYLIVSSLPL
jgi:hypothetical protein